MFEPSFDLDDVEAFTAGTVGPAGERVFFVQAVSSKATVTLRAEKQQVLALADYLADMLKDLPHPDISSIPEPVGLKAPIEPAWSIASMGVAFVESRDRVALWAEQFQREETDVAPATARFQLTRAQVVAFVRDARSLVSAGRPPCPFCISPLNDGGDWCPCWN